MAWLRLALRVSGAGLLLATAAIHLDLYLTGYRSIPTIGGLFLFQVAVAGVLGALVLVFSSRLVAAAGAGFAISTLGGYLLTLWIGLFGFREVRTESGIVAGLVEIAAFGVLAVLALAPGSLGQPASLQARANGPARWPQFGVRSIGLGVAALCALAIVVLSVSAVFEGPAGTVGSTALLRIGRVDGIKVLTDARGLTLYWFAPDTSSKSNCNGTCAAYWPPLTGSPAATTGVLGTLGTIRRSDGASQATYDGHPLYTYVGDGAPGQANGNNLNLNGGIWHEVTVSG
jgi:predicted lipoprotein with Yx(FWY)xxD motif